MALRPKSSTRGKPKLSGKTRARKGASASTSSAKPKVQRPTPKQQKTKPGVHVHQPTKKKQRVYTDKELGLPTLNAIVPANAPSKTKGGSGKKRHPVYVDDVETMHTILAIVNAEKEGQIESKMIKMRRMEEIREARQKEQEAKAQKKKRELESVKDGLKRSKKGSKETEEGDAGSELRKSRPNANGADTKVRKRVSFADVP